MRVLMVEDEKYMAKAVAEVLKKNHYTVDLAYDGAYGLDCAVTGIYDIVILDIMLPKRDGLSILKEMREMGMDVPVILLTARDQLSDKVKGLDLGADDYLAKPFHTDELLARLRALGRRRANLDVDGVLAFADVKLTPHTLMLACGAMEIKLTPKEAQVLEILIKNKNMVVSKETFIEKVWGYDTHAEDNSVETHISLLRKKLRKIRSNASIQTIRGLGYTFIENAAG